MSKPILCLDFDGVIHSYTSGWQGPSTISDPPVPGAMAFIIEALKHFAVAIYSSRSGQAFGIRAMKNYVDEHLYEYLKSSGLCTVEAASGEARRITTETISWPTEKPSAFITIDDRALTFTGVWPSIESLLDFKPWNKRPAPTPGVFRSRPTMIQAWQYPGDMHGVCRCGDGNGKDHLHTAHGGQTVELEVGDWIVPEPVVLKRYYPIKPDVFAKKYEPVVAEPPAADFDWGALQKLRKASP